jgi:hypothetical protein
LAAALRKHSGQRQSAAPVGIGSRAVSAAHQQSFDNPHENSVPHWEQASRRGVGV